MSKSSDKILKKFGFSLVKDIKKAIPKATGQTAKSVRIDFTKTGFAIFGGAQIGAIIDGRGPTSQGAKKGSPTLQEDILDWIQSLTIRPNDPNMSLESLSWAIATHIHKNGYKGKGNIFAKVLTKARFNQLTKTLLKDKVLSLQSDVIKEIKFE